MQASADAGYNRSSLRVCTWVLLCTAAAGRSHTHTRSVTHNTPNHRAVDNGHHNRALTSGQWPSGPVATNQVEPTTTSLWHQVPPAAPGSPALYPAKVGPRQNLSITTTAVSSSRGGERKEDLKKGKCGPPSGRPPGLVLARCASHRRRRASMEINLVARALEALPERLQVGENSRASDLLRALAEEPGGELAALLAIEHLQLHASNLAGNVGFDEYLARGGQIEPQACVLCMSDAEPFEHVLVPSLAHYLEHYYAHLVFQTPGVDARAQTATTSALAMMARRGSAPSLLAHNEPERIKYFLSPSVLASYFHFDCRRYLNLSCSGAMKRIGQASVNPFTNNSAFRDALLGRGLAWEAECIDMIEKRVLRSDWWLLTSYDLPSLARRDSLGMAAVAQVGGAEDEQSNGIDAGRASGENEREESASASSAENPERNVLHVGRFAHLHANCRCAPHLFEPRVDLPRPPRSASSRRRGAHPCRVL